MISQTAHCWFLTKNNLWKRNHLSLNNSSVSYCIKINHCKCIPYILNTCIVNAFACLFIAWFCKVISILHLTLRWILNEKKYLLIIASFLCRFVVAFPNCVCKTWFLVTFRKLCILVCKFLIPFVLLDYFINVFISAKRSC